MSVHKPKLKNIPQKTQDAFVQHHLPYELWMMRESLAAARRGAPTRAQQNLNVEGFAIHARNLIEFLKNGDDCGFDPTDFTTDAFAKRAFIRPTLVDMINQQISHLTSNRTENQKEKFDEPQWRETASLVEEEFKRWTNNLSHEWAAKWEKRERMDEAAASEATIKAHFGGQSSAPMSISSSSVVIGATAGPPPQEDCK